MFSAQTIMYWSIAASTIMGFIHIAFSVAVHNDATSQKKSESTGSIFVGPFFWALAVLFGGVLIAALYWLMHHSTLQQE
jgi:hypothetical protein